MDLAALIVQRGTLKGKLTRAANFVASFSASTGNVREIKVRYDDLASMFDKLENVQTQIELADPSEERLPVHEQERTANEQKYYQTKAAMERILFPTSHNSSFNDSQITQSRVQLPQLQLPSFHGSIKDWPVFKNIFESAVDKTDIPVLHKFQYLKVSLKGEAAGLISSLLITESNYNKAWEILIQRYENKTIIVNHHIKSFMNYPTVTRFNLKEFLVTLQQSLDSLRALDLSVDGWDVLLVFIITQKLDNSLRAAWEMSRKETTIPKYKELSEFLSLRVTAFEMMTERQLDKPSSSQTRMSHLTSVYQPKHLCSKTSCFTCRGKHHTSIHLDTQGKVNYAAVADNCSQQTHTLDTYSQQTSDSPNIQPYSQQTLDVPSTHTYSQQTTNIPSTQPCSQQNPNTHSVHTYSQQAHTSQSIPTDIQTYKQLSTPTATTNLKTASTSTVMLANTNAPQILLSTAIINIRDTHGRWHKARALLDSGSEVNIMSNQLATRLQHKLTYNSCLIQGVGNTHKQTQVSATTDIGSRFNNYHANLTFVVMDNITVPLPHSFINTQAWNLPISQARMLADPTFFVPGNIDLLLGAEIFYDILQSGHIRLGSSMPQLIETRLGWLVSGSYVADINSIKSPQVSLFVTAQQTDDLLCRFWEQEEVRPQKIFSKEQQYCEQLFQDTTCQTESGHYMVNLPIVPEKLTELGNSFNTAYRCLLQLENRLQKDANLHNEYKKFIHEFIELGHAEYISDFNQPTCLNKSYYLPHHAVLKPDSQSTKLRTVFNGTAKTSTGISLNDILLEGPNIYNDLLDIILRFRLYKYVFTSDIVKMFRNILINPDQRSLQRVLWRDSKSDPLQCIQLSTVTYGTKCAPYLACRTLRDLAEKNKHKYPLATDCIQSDCYMDDFLSGGQSLDHVRELCTQLIELLNTANFKLHKWSANHRSILEHVHLLDLDADQYNSSYDFTPEYIVKTLGLRWMPSSDRFQIHIPDFQDVKPTKRHVLSQISQIFDPIGVLAPTTILAKILMQDIWKLKLSWDSELPTQIQHTWFEFCKKLGELRSIQIPRCYFSDLPLTITLVGFCDSSVKSFGGCLYLHATYNSKKPTCTLIMAKTRVAPIRTQSVPRLELSGALLLAQITDRFLNATANKININNTVLFTDSLIVLNWIKTPFNRKLNSYVSHRLSQIIETTKSESWHYVNTKENPADFLTRGVYPDKLPTLNLWWQGPSWLLDNQISWPLTMPSVPTDSELTEVIPKPKANFHVVANYQQNHFYDIFTKYSSFSKLVRIVAFVRRFIHNLKNKQDRLASHLSVQELDKATSFVVKVVQEQAFPRELKELEKLKSHSDSHSFKIDNNLFTFKSSPLRKLNVFIDSDGLIRAGGRLRHSDIPYNHAHPIILPAREHITTLIIQHYHLKLLHTGTQTTLSTIRFKYWPINGRSEVQKVIHRCIRCIRFRAQACGQQMADLPAPRVTLHRPFTDVGVDYSGAIYIRTSMARNCRYQKGYICLFVCLATKNLHLEIVSDLTSQAFICALKRFISRRGVCKCLYSDNASSFKGSNNELADLYKMFKNESSYSEIVNYCAMNSMQWKFTIPLASHMGGIYEAGIKAVKSLLKRHLCNARLTYELMYTLLVQVEGILNSRPLCALTDLPNDLEYLTPSHFVLGAAITDLPEPNLSDMNENRLNMYQKVSQMKQRIWKQFYNNYLSELLPRNKWLKLKANLKLGDMIIVKDEATPPSCWPLGRVIAVNKNSTDGLVRSVVIRTATGEYTRPIHKLVLLPDHRTV